MASLTRYVGPNHSRTVKKTTWYLAVAAGSYVLACVLFATWMLFRWVSMGKSPLNASSVDPDTRAIVMLILWIFPFLVFMTVRAIYKHSSRRNRLDKAETNVRAIFKLLGAEGVKALNHVSDKVVINHGTRFDDDDAGYVVQDEKDRGKIRDFEWDMGEDE